MVQIFKSTPRQDGFRMPGEFESHSRCWMLWPERKDNWRLNAEPARKAFAEVAHAVSEFEPVCVGVSDRQLGTATQYLSASITIVEMDSDDAWMRDVGPTFVKNEQGIVRGIDWEFNAWGGFNGGLYYPWENDARVARKVLENQGIDRYKAPLILEGGSVHTDGQGTLLTTEECLLNPNRNSELSRSEIEDLLKNYLNVNKIIWLDKGVFMDETDGHVDNLCCFIKPGEVLLHWTDDRSDPQYPISCEALDRLTRTSDAVGRKLVVHKIRQPGPLYITREESLGREQEPYTKARCENDRMPGSYVNFYMANNGIVMPLFNDPCDIEAKALIQSLFPNRRVVGIPAREILLGGGNIHCITQQQP